METVILYCEWLPLPKMDFSILTMIAEQGGEFCGNYSDMCRYLSVTPQNRNRKAIQSAIESLASKNYITWEQQGRTHHLTIIPKEREIAFPREGVLSVLRHDYSTENVSRAQVLKVFMWIAQNKIEIVTNQMIADAIGVSVSTVVSAKNVLEREYENITKKRISEKIDDDFYINLGQKLAACAWWNEI
jgi:hypothetical protein